tara:strand:- start:1418 stop:2293 length:876 start_codon:yes stop_codon:yes gene_type:complete
MTENINLVVVGNCQAAPLARIIKLLNARINVTAIATVHKLDDSLESDYTEHFESADVIVTQPISDTYQCKFVRTNILEENFSEKILKIVNLFYAGYHPDWIYIKGNDNRIITGPMTDYHNKTILDGWKNGSSLEDVASNLRSPKYNLKKFSKVPTSSLEELKRRELEVDVAITDYIEFNLKSAQLFYTFNHPSKLLLVEYARRILERLKLDSNLNSVATIPEPLNRIILPINPISQGEEAERVIRGVSVDVNGGLSPKFTNAECFYTDRELIQCFYSVYDSENLKGNLDRN